MTKAKPAPNLRRDFVKALEQARLQSDILYAYKKLTGKKPYKYQVKFLLSTDRLEAVLKSRQTGFTYAAAFKKFWLTWTGKSESEIIMSVSQRASNTVMGYIKQFAQKAHLTNADATTWNNEQITWLNGSSIYSLPQSPSTVRSLHGNVLLDECAHYEHGLEILRAVLPFTSRGYGLTAITTPAGMDEVFYKAIWQGEHFVKTEVPWWDCPDLTEDNLKPIWDTMDEESKAQEYECKFIDEAHAYFSYALLSSRKDSELNCLIIKNPPTDEFVEHPSDDGNEPWVEYIGENIPSEARYMGFDVGRHKDSTEFIFLDGEGKVIGIVTFHAVAYRYQKGYARACMKRGIMQACIDRTGIGNNIAEDLEYEFGSRVEGVTFTRESKEEMITDLHIAFETRGDGLKITIPDNRELINQLHSIRKTPTEHGVKFEVEENDKHHGDKAWALALAWRAGFKLDHGQGWGGESVDLDETVFA